ncbi:MAG: malonyl-CoA synthase [Candidatus Velthaea sp.]
MTLLDLFDGARRDRGHSFAVNDVSYNDLHTGALRVAGELTRRGVKPGDRVAIYSENRIGFVYAYVAVLRIGAIVVPVNVLYRAAELEHVLCNARVSFAITTAQTHPHLGNLGELYREIDAADIERWARDERLPADLPVSAPVADDVATIVYTSGTTGRSKGAMLTHGNFAAIASQLVASWRWSAADTLAIALPLFHVHGLGAALNGTLAAGARIIIHERFDANVMLETLRHADVTMFFGVPTMYVRLLEALEGGAQAPQLRLCVSGSAALDAELHRTFRERYGIDILERYGATEFGFALGNRYGGPRLAGSVGTTFPGVRVRIDAPQDGVGELLVSGPNVFPGYWDLPQASADAFLVDADGTRWYRSGDLAAYDGDRHTYSIVGRLKELIISGGFNIYPREIENEIDAYPGVVASAVIGVPDPARGELPVAYIEISASIDTESLLATLRERLASFKVPKAVHIVDALPRNALGKIEKPKLRAPQPVPATRT